MVVGVLVCDGGCEWWSVHWYVMVCVRMVVGVLVWVGGKNVCTGKRGRVICEGSVDAIVKREDRM